MWDSIQGASYAVEHGDACRYDGDGRAISPCDNEAPMLSYDGENVLRANPGGNAAHFIDGPATDDPLVVLTRTGGSGTRELFYLTDGAGRQYAVGDSAGTMDASDSSEAQFSAWKWSGGTSNAQSFNASRMAGPSIPGLAFFRNRLYDQATGQWTQEDPAGIGGGVNLYQFNGNNPVNYSDPFGLCPIARDGIPCQAVFIHGAHTNNGALLIALNRIAAEQDRPLYVNSAFRDPRENAAVGGVPGSTHTTDNAADVRLGGLTKAQTSQALLDSHARQAAGLRLIYHTPGAAVPEHSHLEFDPRGRADVEELPATRNASGKLIRHWQTLHPASGTQ